FSNAISEDLIANNLNGHIRCMEESVAEFYAIYGGLFFLGIFLGLLFIMATVLIIYYKQISEGYDDQKRFNIMQKVGMSHKEVKKSIHSQVLTVFFLPIVMAIIHVSFAFPITVKLLALLGLLNTVLFAWCTVATVLVFLILYAIVYTLTAKTYYKIVKKG
ncbi:MAG: FtsX-like permease family protein, partial [Oscillospiraceae bacterium]